MRTNYLALRGFWNGGYNSGGMTDPMETMGESSGRKRSGRRLCPGLVPGPRVAVTVLLTACAGCHTSYDNFSRVINEPAPVSADVRASFGTVGVLPASRAAQELPPPQASPAQSGTAGMSAPPGLRMDLTWEHPAPSPDKDPLRAGGGLASNTSTRHPATGPNSSPGSSQKPRGPADSHPSGGHAGSGAASTGTVHPGHWANNKSPASSPAGGEHDRGHSSGGAHSSPGAGDVLSLAGLLASGSGDASGDGPGEGGFYSELLDAVGVIKEKVLEHQEAKGIKKGVAALRKVAREDPLRSGFEERLVQLASKWHCEKLVPAPEQALAATASGATNADGQTPKNPGIDSVLRVSICDERFEIDGFHRMAFAADAEVGVWRLADGLRLHQGKLIYQSRDRGFSDWGAHHARRLRGEMKTAQRVFAQALLQELFDVDTIRH
jgi:hypothetical protein